MAQFTEVYEGQFNLNETGVNELIKSLEKLDTVAKRVATNLSKIKIKGIGEAGATKADGFSNVASNAEKAAKKVKESVSQMVVEVKSIARVGDSLTGKEIVPKQFFLGPTREAQAATEKIKTSVRELPKFANLSFAEMTEAIRSQFARLPDKTSPIFFRITDQYKQLVNLVNSEAISEQTATKWAVALSRELDRVAAVQAKLKGETKAMQAQVTGGAQAIILDDKLKKLDTEFQNVAKSSNLTTTSIRDRWGGVQLLFSSTGSSLQGLREVFSGTNASSNLFVKGLDALIARRDPIRALSSDMAKSISDIARATDKSIASIQAQQSVLKRVFTKEVGEGVASFERFNEQLTKTNAAIKQVEVTASGGGNIAQAVIRARVEVDNLRTRYELLRDQGIIPAGSESDIMFKAIINQAKSVEPRLQAMAGRYENVKKKIEETKRKQDEQAASGNKQVTIFGRISLSLQNLLNVFNRSKTSIDQTRQSFQQLDSQIQRTTSLTDIFKGSFLGAFSGTFLALNTQFGNFFSSLTSNFFNLNNTIQNTKITIRGMLEGSGVDAQKAIEGFTEFVTEQVAKTPFEFDDAIQQSLRLVQQGFDPQLWFTPAANAAAAMNKPMEQFIGGMVKLQAGAKGAAVDMFRDFGLNVNQISGFFDEATGKALSFKEVQKRTQEGTIENAKKMSFEFDKQGSLANSTGEALNILNAYLSQNATFAKAAEARSQSLSGVISNLKDNVSKTLIAFGQPIFEKLTVGASGLLGFLDRVSPAIQLAATQLGTSLASGIDFVTNLINGSLVPSLNNGETALGRLVNTVILLAQGEWQAAWTLVLDTVSGVLDSVLSYLDDFASDAYDWGASFINQIANGILDAASAVLDAVAEIGNSIASFLMPGSPPEAGPLKDIDSWGKGIMETFTSSMAEVTTTGVESAIDRIAKPFDMFNRRFDLGRARSQVMALRQQILAAEKGGFIPAELKQQLALAEDKVVLLEQQAQMQEQLAKAEADSKKEEKQAAAGGAGRKGAGGGGGGSSPKDRVGTEKKTAQQIRDDALAILDKQLNDGIIKYEDYAKDRLKIEKDFYEDTLKESGQVSQQNIDDIKRFQGEVDKISASGKKKKGEVGDPTELFKPPTVAEIFQGFIKNTTESMTDAGTESAKAFVAAIKENTVGRLATVKTDVVKKFDEITTSATENIVGLFEKIRAAIKPEYLPIIGLVVGGLVKLASGPVVAGLASLAGTFGTMLANLGPLLLTMARFTVIGLVITAIFLNWDKISAAAAAGIEYVRGVFDEFVKSSGGLEALKNNFNAAINVLKTQAIAAFKKILSGLKKLVADFNWKGAFYSLKKAITEIDFSALKNSLSNLFDPLVEVIGPKLTDLKNKLVGLIPPQLKAQIDGIVLGIQQFFTFAQGSFGGELLNLFKQLGELWVVMTPIMKVFTIGLIALAGIIVNIFVASLQGIISALPFITQALTGLITFVTGLVDTFTGIVLLIRAAFAAITGDSEGASALLQQAFANLSAGIGEIWRGILQIIIGAGMAILSFITSTLGNFIANIFTFIPGFEQWGVAIRAITNEIVNIIYSLSTRAIAIVTGMGNQIAIIFGYLMNNPLAVIEGFYNAVIGFFIQLYKDIVGESYIPDLVNGIFTWLTTLKDQGIVLISDTIKGWVDRFSEAIKEFTQIGADIITGLIKGINEQKDKVIEVLKQLAKDAIAGAAAALGISSPSIKFHELGIQTVEGFIRGVRQQMPTAKDTLNAISESIDDLLETGLDNAKADAVFKQLKRGFKANFDEIIALGKEAGGKLLANLVDTEALGIHGGVEGEFVQSVAESFVQQAIEEQEKQPARFAKAQAKVFEQITKIQDEFVGKFNQGVFNVKTSATEARIQLDQLFNRTVSDAEVGKMAKALEGIPVDQLTDQQKLILQNYELQKDRVDALKQEVNVQGQIVKMGQVTGKAQELFDKLFPKKPPTEQAEQAGNDILKALGLGMDAGADDVFARLNDAILNIINKVEHAFGISSPSTLFMGYGKHLMTGLSKGIEGATGKVGDAMEGVQNVLTGGISPQLALLAPVVETGLMGDVGKLPIITGQNGSIPPINITMNNTINNEFDETVFNSKVRNAVIRALRNRQ